MGGEEGRRGGGKGGGNVWRMGGEQGGGKGGRRGGGGRGEWEGEDGERIERAAEEQGGRGERVLGTRKRERC